MFKKVLASILVVLTVISGVVFAAEENAYIPITVGLPYDSDQQTEGMHYWPDGRYEVFIAFDDQFSDDEPDWYDKWKINVEERYADYITINGKTVRQFLDDKPPTDNYSIMIHIDLVDNGLRVYCKEGIDSALDPTKENTIIVDKTFPMLNGNTLGTTYKFVYDPSTKEWTGSIAENETSTPSDAGASTGGSSQEGAEISTDAGSQAGDAENPKTGDTNILLLIALMTGAIIIFAIVFKKVNSTGKEAC